MAKNMNTSNTKRRSVLHWIGGLFMGALVLTAGPAWAEYEPGRTNPPQQASGAGGSRYMEPPTNLELLPDVGYRSSNLDICDPEAGTLPLIALAPQSHVGQASSSHPTFLWYMPDAESYSVELNLYQDDDGQPGQLISSHSLQSSPGLMSFTLPDTQPGLTLGNRYIWQVAVRCHPDSLANTAIVQLPIDIVALPADMAARLEQATDSRDRVTIYATAGLWYDALAEAGPDPDAETRSLLQDLAATETTREPEFAAYIRELIATLYSEL